ncbi:efflux RND transporter periplasmic adaptor subunit [Sphingomonas sp.]|uniref:efflux RND transporter periplasmic adaptor subunit n=1 Tax=Sphingomonas sp. TaxID=28214 RepID=UPI0025D6313C|nr:efflux RND transporter periplasmic adaptor subunit [Sphingomonas sp.]
MKLYPILLLPMFALTACGEAEAPTAEVAPTATVKSARASLGISAGDLAVYGVTEAGPGGEQSVVAAREAILTAILAPTGTAVRAGQPIVTLRPSPTAALERAKASSDATLANAALSRALRLRSDGLVSDADVETARAAVRAAVATQAATGSGGNVLRAPAAGTVQALNARPGDQIAAGTAVASVAIAGERRARFGVDPATAARIHPGQSIRIDGLSGGAATTAATVTATVVGVDPAVDATTRLASVFARLPVTFGVGTPLRGHIAIGGQTSGVTIPYAALLDDGGKSFVFVIDRGVAKRRDVAPGNTAGDSVTILTGLKEGERVVTEGGTALEDGMKIREAGSAAR